MLKKLCLGLAIVLGVAAGVNGLYMLYAPESWYFAVPGVTTTGPFNQHFIRDIGLIFLFLGTAFLVGAARPQYRIVLWATATLWLWGHALFHFWEVADFPAVTLPAILGTILTLWAVSNARAERAVPART